MQNVILGLSAKRVLAGAPRNRRGRAARLRLLGFALGPLLYCTALGATQEPALDNLANIRFATDIRLFTVMASLNAAGFDAETAGRQMSDVRAEVRRRLDDLEVGLKARLSHFYRERLELLDPDNPQVAYTSLSLVLSGPPDFKLAIDEKDLPEDVRLVRGFEELAAEVYRNANLEELWNRLRPRYESELRAYQPILREIILETLRYFRVPARIVLDRQIILTADLLDVKEIVNARNLEKTYTIVAGPSDDPANNRRQLQHEYLHFLVDPLIAKYGATLLRHEKLLDLAQRQPEISSQLQNQFLLVVAESLIEALQLRLNPNSSGSGDRELAELFRRGLILSPYFWRALERYETSDLVQLPSYLETIFLGIQESKIEGDAGYVASVEQSLREQEERIRAEAEAARLEAERRSRVQDLFNEASALLRDNDDEAAENKLLEALQIDPDYGNAFFYLAQISARRQDHESALDFYRRTSEAKSVQPWVRAQSLLGAGRILAFKGQFADARRLFTQVEAMEGELRGAREQARELLTKLPN